MTKRYLQLAFAGLAIAAVATACHGSNGYLPGGGQAGAPNLARAGAAVPPPIAQALRDRGMTDDSIAAIPACTAPVGKIPGQYTSFLATGNVKGTTFTSTSGYSLYFVANYVKATPVPTTSPSTGPTTSPTSRPTAPPPEYFYYGTFTLKKGAGGCVYLIATVSQKPPKGSKTNAAGLGFPNLKGTYRSKYPLVAEGPLDLKVSGLSASGGSGPLTLLKKTGGTYNTGIVKLTGRMKLP